ncbi:PAS domain-containing sensor histidine kinase [Roseospira goensis]|uniref:histidine kinase n=1 Tax=Roseospira goensis TaxID=391922 RepID=A0A7W6S278_9PROT|nr:PAS domain-containing protein [Roseospira goensis]MBB4287528.1 PAS domain S-box-containing protein [Roseospira goensis]
MDTPCSGHPGSAVDHDRPLAATAPAPSQRLSDSDIRSCLDGTGVEALVRDLEGTLGLPAAVLDRSGARLAGTPLPAICEACQRGATGRLPCATGGTPATETGAAEAAGPALCPHGLTACLTSIEADGHQIATLMVGPLVAQAPDPDRLATLRAWCGSASAPVETAPATAPETAPETAADGTSVPLLPSDRLPGLMGTLRVLAAAAGRAALAEARARAASARSERLLAERTARLHEAESRLRRIAEQVPGVVYQYRLYPDGRSCFPYASEGIRSIYGFAPEDVREDASPLYAVLHPDDHAAVCDSVRRSARDATEWHEQYRVVHPVKGVIWVEGRARPETLADGSVLWHGLILDVTERVRQDEALRTVQDRYRRVTAALRDGTFDVDLRRREADVDARFFEMLGYPDRAFPVTATEWIRRMHPEDAATVQQDLAAQIQHGDLFRIEYRTQTADGGWRWIESRGRVVEREDGRPLRLIGTNADISDRKAVEAALLESEARFRALFEHSPVAYLALDALGRITEVNDPFSTLLGYSRDNLCGQVLQAYLASATRAAGASLIAAVLKGTRDGGELTLVRADGTELAVHLVARVEYDHCGHYVRTHCVIHDITEHTRLEARLARSNADLTQFAYAVSHDLREPLRMVTGFLGLIDRRVNASMDEELRQFMDFALDGAQRMNAMILDLLEYSRLGRAETEPEPVPLEGVVADALRNLTAAIADRAAEVTVPHALPTVTGDRSELVRLFQNLIGNAVKFVPAERRPVVTVSCRNDGSGRWRLEVADNGQGVPADQRERVFGVFQRLVDRTQYDGTGVGLALCRRIVERHGGTIWIEDAPGGGTLLCFTLPKQQRPARRADDSPADADRQGLFNMLNMHQVRIVGRLKNLLDTVRRREVPAETAPGEAEFLVREVEAYRVFVHAHADAIFGHGLSPDDADPRAEADSLMFAVHRSIESLQQPSPAEPIDWVQVLKALNALLDHVSHTHSRLQALRAERVAGRRAVPAPEAWHGRAPATWGAA